MDKFQPWLVNRLVVGGATGRPGHGPWVGTPAAPGADGGQPTVTAATYWRRRTLALALGIGLLTILVWAVNGILSGGRAAGQAGGSGPAVARSGNHGHGTGSGRARTGHGSGHAGAGRAGQAGTRPGASRPGASRPGASRPGASRPGVAAMGRPGLTGQVTRQPDSGAGRVGTGAIAGHGAAPRAPANPAGGGSPPGSRSATRPTRAGPSSRRSTSHGATAPHGGPAPGCGPGQVALSLFTPEYWYEQGQQPQFVIAAATTGARPCRFNMGARYASVVISYDGSRIWSSADCVRGSGTRSVVLAPGRPAISWVTWDRRTSVPGCGPSGHAVRGGTYIVTADSARLRSQGMIIVLSAPRVAVP